MALVTNERAQVKLGVPGVGAGIVETLDQRICVPAGDRHQPDIFSADGHFVGRGPSGRIGHSMGVIISLFTLARCPGLPEPSALKVSYGADSLDLSDTVYKKPLDFLKFLTDLTQLGDA